MQFLPRTEDSWVSLQLKYEMLSDRRIITDNEIFSLIQWRLERHCIEDENTSGMVISVGGKPILEIIPKGELLEKLQKIIKKDKENDNTCTKVGRS